MKKLILREFMNGTGICSPDGWVYKDHLLTTSFEELIPYIRVGKTIVKEMVLIFYAKGWITKN